MNDTTEDNPINQNTVKVEMNRIEVLKGTARRITPTLIGGGGIKYVIGAYLSIIDMPRLLNYTVL